ncbi:CD177 antigen-like [Pteronotus mesoamericanus]|uniref:CD177 antigen-like n=1 Tax=Pteronotus mesoamericanus TaxID=1884717 RepID=UPI0023EDC4FA|nr:CD177 antigen-like [Pteronotus parnellii mesoamericanus]
MSPALLPALLGLTLVLPGAQALTCHSGSAMAVREATELPLTWTVGEEDCREGWGCQDTVMLLENGPLVLLVITKGCTQEEDQEARVTQHWATPGLSIVSYTRVCRREDLCNDLSSTRSLSTPPLPTFPGTVRCPVCLSTEGCETAPEVTCPVGHTHCYNGILQLRGGGIDAKLRVQGCMSQAACNLLNETRGIGPLSVSEKCTTNGTVPLTCQSGRLVSVRNATELPLEWNAGKEDCGEGWGCQDTLMLLENGPQVLLVLTKGCTQEEDHEARITQHREGPGLSIVSYTRVCRHEDLCNDLPNTVPLWALPPTAGPGTVRCPLCLSTEGCESATEVTCPVGHTHCYNGILKLRGGGINAKLRVQGCMSQAACNLLNETQKIGPLSASEKCPTKGGQTLTCHSGSAMAVREATELPLTWTVGEEDCREGWGCQDTVMLLENGPQVFLVITKGCTQEKDHEARVTRHQEGPGLSIVSYTRVCRREDLCNDLFSTRRLWTPPPPTLPGTVHCPVCFSTEGCDSPTEVTCPVGHSHCYNGLLQLRGGGINTNLRVQGCTSQAACNLLNGTRKVGRLSVSESCETDAFRTCQKGIMLRFKENLAKEPVEWDAFTTVKCDLDEVCQETLLLIDVGPRSLIVGSKGCGKAETPDSQTVSIHSGPPGVLAASYTHFCSSNGCNNASSTSVLLNSLPGPAAPAAGDLQCPACVQMSRFCTSSITVRCPKGTTHCYKGYISLKGGGLSSPLSIQGCMAQPSNSLLNHTNRIGPFHTAEFPEDVNKDLQSRAAPKDLQRGGASKDPHSGAAPAPYLAQVVGLGLSLALWCAVTSLLTLLPCDS